MDALDHRILLLLADDARRPYAEVARELGVSQPTVAERVKRMEERGVIRGATLRLDLSKLGFAIDAFVRIAANPREQDKVERAAQAIPQVIELSRVTGEDALIARVALRSVAELSEVLAKLSLHGASNTSIVLGTPIPPRAPLVPVAVAARPAAGSRAAAAKPPVRGRRTPR